MVALLGPCIRPPWYEIDFAATIARQCELAGIGVVCDCGITTASDLDRYYSYRVEKGRTGRMLALLGLAG
jgi:copper oxidase (laccase) domain-containing protein